jgi:hypothetical protein
MKKLIIVYAGIVVLIVLFVILPLLAHEFGFMNLRGPSWIILGATAIGILINTLTGFLATGNVEVHRMGLNFCGIALGASLSNGAIQLTQDENTLPGLSAFPNWFNFAWATENDINQTLSFLGAWFVLSIMFGLLCASHTKTILEPGEGKILWIIRIKTLLPVLEALSFLYGTMLVGLYVIVLVMKG